MGAPAREAYEFGEPLGREGLLQLVAEEMFRDGDFDQEDRQCLEAFLKYLELDPLLVRKWTYRSRLKQRSGELGQERAFHPLRLYRRVLRYLQAAPSAEEELIVRACRGVLQISERTHRNVLEDAKKKLRVTENVRILRVVPPPAPSRLAWSWAALALGVIAGGCAVLAQSLLR